MAGNIKSIVDVVINATPRLKADVSGNEWPTHSHAAHTGLDADDHLHYMTNAAGPDRHHTGDVYFDARLVGDTDLRLDDRFRYLHTFGGGDWDEDGIDLSASAQEWQDLYDAAGGIVSLIGALTMGITGPGGGGGVTLDGAYDWGGSGAGRSILADTGSVEINVPDASNNATLKLLQNDVTNNKDCLDIYHQGTGYSIYMHGTAADYKVYADGVMTVGTLGNLNLNGGSNINFVDGHQLGTLWAIPMAFSLNSAEWTVARSLLGDIDGSLLGLIAAAAAYPSGNLDDAYHWGGAGTGRSITVDEGAVQFEVPAAGSTRVLSLTNSEATNAYAVLDINNEATLSTGYAIFLDGAAGGGGTDYDEFGHFIWTDGSVTIGHGTGTGDAVRRSYTVYDYNNDAAVNWASCEMRSEADTGYSQYASVLCKAGNYGAISARIDLDTTGYIALDSTLSTSLTSGGTMTFDSSGVLRFSDANRSGSSWTSSYMNLSTGTEWSDIETLIGSEGTLFGAILAAASVGGSVSEPDTQIVWGTGSGVDSDAYLTYDDSTHTLSTEKLILENAAYGTPDTATWTSGTNTVSVNFATGKDYQYVSVDDDVDNFSISTPSNGAAKGLVLEILGDGTTATTVGGGTGWSSVKWEVDGPQLGSETVAFPSGVGAKVVLTFTYNGSTWSGWVSRFEGVGV